MSIQPSQSPKSETSSTVSGNKNEKNGKNGGSGKSAKTSLMTIKDPPTPNTSGGCFICKEKHGFYQCAAFNAMTPVQRFESLKKWGGCKICLAYSHETKACQSAKPQCRICKRSHNALLCLAKTASPQSGISGSSSSSPGSQNSPTLIGSTLNSQPAEGAVYALGVVHIYITFINVRFGQN